MQTNHVQISYDSWNVLPLRTQDWFIMDDLIDQDLPWFKLECLNACWMHLQITTLAEITDQTGEELLVQILTSYHYHAPKGLLNISQSTLK